MKLTNKQQQVLNAVKSGEHVRNFGFNTWRWAGEVVTPSVKVLLRKGLVEQRWATGKWSKFDRYYELYIPGSDIDYSADSASGDADRITPDPEGECVDDAVTVVPAPTSPYTPRLLWRFKMAMMMRYGRYAAQAKRAFALFDSIYPQYA